MTCSIINNQQLSKLGHFTLQSCGTRKHPLPSNPSRKYRSMISQCSPVSFSRFTRWLLIVVWKFEIVKVFSNNLRGISRTTGPILGLFVLIWHFEFFFFFLNKQKLNFRYDLSSKLYVYMDKARLISNFKWNNTDS